MNQGHLPLSETHINIIRTAKDRISSNVKSAVWPTSQNQMVKSLTIGASLNFIHYLWCLCICTQTIRAFIMALLTVFPLLRMDPSMFCFSFCKYTCVSTLLLACVVSERFLSDNHMCKRLRVIAFIWTCGFPERHFFLMCVITNIIRALT